MKTLFIKHRVQRSNNFPGLIAISCLCWCPSISQTHSYSRNSRKAHLLSSLQSVFNYTSTYHIKTSYILVYIYIYEY